MIRAAALLDGYHEERHAVGEELIEHTTAQAALISATTPEATALRSLLNGLVADVWWAAEDADQTTARALRDLGVRFPALVPATS